MIVARVGSTFVDDDRKKFVTSALVAEGLQHAHDNYFLTHMKRAKETRCSAQSLHNAVHNLFLSSLVSESAQHS